MFCENERRRLAKEKQKFNSALDPESSEREMYLAAAGADDGFADYSFLAISANLKSIREDVRLINFMGELIAR